MARRTSKPRVKTARTVNGNMGTKAKAVRALKRLSRGAFIAVLKDMVEEAERIDSLGNGGAVGFARDWSLSRPTGKTRKALVARLAKLIDKMSPSKRKTFQESLGRLGMKWSQALREDVQAFASWYARTTASEVTTSLRHSLESAGFSTEQLREKWTIPVGRTYMSPAASSALPVVVSEQVEILTKRFISGIDRIQRVLFEEGEGESRERLLKELIERGDRDGLLEKNGAEYLARDITNHVNFEINRANVKEVGITHGVWVHNPGRFTSRSTHLKFHGKLFSLQEGLYDDDAEMNVVPGQLRHCQCTFRPVLPSDVTNGQKNYDQQK